MEYFGILSVSILDEKDELVEEFGDIVNAKIELPIRKNHIDLLIDVFRKKRVRTIFNLRFLTL